MKQRIEPEVAVFPPTYMTGKCKIAVSIVNDSDEVFRYEWRQNSSREEDEDLLATLDLEDPTERDKLTTIFKFHSDTFRIEPDSSEIWPHRYQQVIIIFTPHTAGDFIETLYLYDQDTGNRLPFEIHGNGLPPNARFSVDQINIGHVLLDSITEYKVMLENTGQVALDYEMEQHEKDNYVFEFYPSKGHISIGQAVPIVIRFGANHVGQFNEVFTFHVNGVTANNPSLTIYGRVIGPSFNITRRAISFGNVSFGFLYTEKFDIENKSEIPFEYNLHFIHDGSFEGREFTVSPAGGTIPKFSKHTISVEFIPICIQDYHVQLYLNAPKFDEERLFSIPISATCICPEISIACNLIDLGTIFIGNTAEANITLINETDFPAKFEFLDSADSSTLEAEVKFPKQRGIINSHQNSMLPIKVTPVILGHLRLVRYIRIYGSDSPPIPFTLTALSQGPNISLSTKIINFGTVDVLVDHEQELRIVNDSKIPAKFVVNLPSHVFHIDPLQDTIEPGQTYIMKIVANLDDVIQFKDKLTLNFQHLSQIVVDLKAKGQGTTILSSIDMNLIDFGYLFTIQPATIPFTLKNHGRRPQEIRWSQQKPKVEGNPNANLIYKIIPDSKILNRNESCDFQFIFECNQPCEFQVQPQCSATLNRQRVDLFKPMIQGTYIQPLLQMKETKLTFTYIHDVQKEEKLTGNIKSEKSIGPSKDIMELMKIPNTLVNMSALPLICDAKVEEPFTIIPNHFELKPQEKAEFDVIFNPKFKNTFHSESFDQRAVFSFQNSPHRHFIDIHVDMIFPNLSFSPAGPINFGILLQNTEDNKILQITNTSKVQADFFWEVSDDSKIFGIYPIRGSIKPGDMEEVHVTFFAAQGKQSDGKSSFSTTVICHLIGGPEYPIEIKGSSAKMEYSISPKTFDFGDVDFTRQLTAQVSLTNDSDVPVRYLVRIPKTCDFREFNVNPKQGIAGPREDITFKLVIIPGIPKKFKTPFYIQIGQFDDVQIDIMVNCYAPQLSVSIPPLVPYESNMLPVEYEKMKLIEYLKTSASNHLLKRSKKGQVNGKFSGYVMRTFLIDMGEIIFGEKKKNVYTIASVTPFPLSCEIVNASLTGTGFSVGPTSFKDIPPNENLKISFVFDSAKATRQILGKVEFEIPILFNDNIGYIVILRANLITPSLSFSKTNFNFETTILGQTRILSLQLQNLNAVQVEYKFDPAQSINVVQRNQNNTQSVFVATPSSGVLPPSSFQNIDIAFMPNAEKAFSMQFPVHIKHNSETFYITVKGSGIQMRVLFEPESIVFPPIRPCNEPSYATVNLINPSNYPIDVFSPQFDYKLLYETTDNLATPRVAFSEAQSSTNVSKFSICVIVNGPLRSGRTTISKKIADYLGHVPVVSLKDVWTCDCDFVEEFRKLISGKEFINGFVIDGLDFFPEPAETESFLIHFLKQKNTADELQKNPFYVLTHTSKTASEQALEYILESLNGHYVFHIALNANETVLIEHQQIMEDQEKQKKIEFYTNEMNKLFNMSEDVYQGLTDAEKTEVDEKREYFRKYMIEHNGDLSNYTPKPDPSMKKSQQHKDKQARRPKGRTNVPNDPMLLSVMIFQYTFGCICSRLREGTTFHVVDPSSLGEAPEKSENIMSIGNMNSFIVDVHATVDEIELEIKKYLPSLKLLKEKAFTQLIPNSRLIMPDINVVGSPQIQAMPSNFFILDQSAVEDNEELFYFTKRWQIPPNSKITLNLEFDAPTIGSYQDKLLFSICNCRNDIYKLPVSGICQHPEIDRSIETFFPRTANKMNPKVTYSYITSTKQFHFGSLLIVKEKNGRNSTPAYKQSFNLVNSSAFPAPVTASLTDNNVKTVWSMEHTNQVINPGETGKITIGFHPTSQEFYSAICTILIKDNPAPMTFYVAGEGCAPVIEASTVNLDFEKLLLSQKRTLKLDLNNIGKITAFWKIKGGNTLGTNFSFSALEGIVTAGSSSSIEVTYCSPKPIVFKKTIQIDVLDQSKTRSFMSHHINISAESFDVSFDFMFPKGMKHLEYDTIKVSQSKTIACTLKNKGRYSAGFNFIAKSGLQSLFDISPKEGTITNDKAIQINFTFTGKTTYKYQNAKGLFLSISDSVSGSQTAQIPIPFSVTTVFSSYKVDPEVIIFDPVAINTNQTKEIKIMNKGPFPFEFELVPKLEIVEPPKKSGRFNRNNKHKNQTVQPTQRGKAKKSNGKDFFVGPFNVSQSAGQINPDASATISIQFNSANTGTFNNTIILKASDSPPECAEFMIPLKCTAYAPTLVTNDHERIFPGQHLFMRYDIEKSESTAFLEDDNVFHFAPLVLNQRATINVALINPLLIPCSVELNVKPRGKKHNHLPFDIGEKNVTIEPKSTVLVELGFKPTAIDKFTGDFEAIIKGINTQQSKGLKFGLEGTGTLPSITLVPEKDLSPERTTSVNFGRTLVGLKKEKSIVLLNNGSIPASLTIKANSAPDFRLESLEQQRNFSLPPGRQYTLTVSYAPQGLRKDQFDIFIKVKDNENANIGLSFIGEGFSEDVIFEGLPGDESDLKFNDCVVGVPQTVTFSMRNVCQNDVRFMWTNLPEFTFSPRVGHLRHGQSKEISVTFFSEKPTKISGLLVNCQWVKIELQNPESPNWDDSMKVVKFSQRNTLQPGISPTAPAEPKQTPRKFPGAGTARQRTRSTLEVPMTETSVVFTSPKGPDFDLIKVIEIKPEPAYDVVQSKLKDLSLKIFALSDNIKYQCSVNEIEFAPTMMYETRTASCKITNTSQIKFEYQWDVNNFGSMQSVIANCLKPPFTVEPGSGFIESGQSTNFKIKFSPEDVDDYTAHLKCMIPHISQMEPPEIYVTGRSRRPICHINLETSDYISAGRRHPDFTEPLPEGVKVIEMFATGIGARTTKKFEILHPTDSMYEVNWTCLNDQSNGSIICDTPHAIISSGKRQTVSFSYSPVSVKTVESLWEFSIVEFNIRVPFLVVGRIMPH